MNHNYRDSGYVCEFVDFGHLISPIQYNKIFSLIGQSGESLGRYEGHIIGRYNDDGFITFECWYESNGSGYLDNYLDILILCI